MAAVDYPAMYVTAGLNDPRVGYWEPAKWVAKLRATRTDATPDPAAHRAGRRPPGPSGRYDAWRDEARVQAFMLRAVGIEDYRHRGWDRAVPFSGTRSYRPCQMIVARLGKAP